MRLNILLAIFMPLANFLFIPCARFSFKLFAFIFFIFRFLYIVDTFCQLNILQVFSTNLLLSFLLIFHYDISSFNFPEVNFIAVVLFTQAFRFCIFFRKAFPILKLENILLYFLWFLFGFVFSCRCLIHLGFILWCEIRI